MTTRADPKKGIGRFGRVVILVIAEFIAYGRITAGLRPDEINFQAMIGLTI